MMPAPTRFPPGQLSPWGDWLFLIRPKKLCYVARLGAVKGFAVGAWQQVELLAIKYNRSEELAALPDHGNEVDTE